MVSIGDLTGPDRPPRPLGPGEHLDIGGHVVEWIDTPHVPHGWDAGVLYDHATRTLLCGDLFSRTGAYPGTSTDDIVGPAVAAEDRFSAMSLHPTTSSAICGLADRDIATLAPMHAPAFTGDCRTALHDLAADADRRAQSSRWTA
jgi:flavorubredoxin